MFLGLLSIMVSCQEEVKFNNPAFQGVKDNVFWRAIDSKAILETGGGLTIEAYSRNEKIILKTSSSIPQTYFLGNSTSRMATYILTETAGVIAFSTGSGFGDGQIVITEYDQVGGTVSGTFKFNAVNSSNNPLAGELLNFQQGIFYKVPLVQ